MVLRVTNFATPKNLIVIEHNFPTLKHSRIHLDLTWWKGSQIVHIVINRRWCVSIYEVHLLKAAYYGYYGSLSAGSKSQAETVRR